jgi:hypothetical protein
MSCHSVIKVVGIVVGSVCVGYGATHESGWLIGLGCFNLAIWLWHPTDDE